jgi:flagellar hook-basal body complex protein FliE
MPLPISAIPTVGASMPTAAISPIAAPVVPSAGTVGQVGAPSFAAQLTGAIDGLQDLQATSSGLAVKAVTGDLTDIHDATIAAARSAVTLELMATVRNTGVQAFNEIMRMQA